MAVDQASILSHLDHHNHFLGSLAASSIDPSPSILLYSRSPFSDIASRMISRKGMYERDKGLQ